MPQGYCKIIRIFAKHLTIALQLTFKKEERLKSRKRIEQLFVSGKKISVFLLTIKYILSGPEKNVLQSGFGVSAKKFGKAVNRNRLKRLMREAYRLQKNSLKQVLENNHKSMTVFFIYTGNTINKYDEIYKAMLVCLKKLEEIADESSDENS